MESSSCWSQGLPPKGSYRHRSWRQPRTEVTRAVDGRAGGVRLPKTTGAQMIPPQPSLRCLNWSCGLWCLRCSVWSYHGLIIPQLCPHGMRMFALCLSTLGNTLVSQRLILKGLPRVSPEELLAFSTVLELLTTVGTFKSWVEFNSY